MEELLDVVSDDETEEEVPDDWVDEPEELEEDAVVCVPVVEELDEGMLAEELLIELECPELVTVDDREEDSPEERELNPAAKK